MYLYILVSIILTLLFAFGCNTAIRKHAGSFYILAALIVLFEVIYYETGLVDTTPEWKPVTSSTLANGVPFQQPCSSS